MQGRSGGTPPRHTGERGQRGGVDISISITADLEECACVCAGVVLGEALQRDD